MSKKLSDDYIRVYCVLEFWNMSDDDQGKIEIEDHPKNGGIGV